MEFAGQYQIAKERAERFVQIYQLERLWPSQAALDVTTMHTDVYENGLTGEEKVRRAILRVEWLARIKAPPLDGLQFGYRDLDSGV